MLFLVLVCLHHLPVNQIHCSIAKASANSDGPIDCKISIWIVSRLNYRLGLQFILLSRCFIFGTTYVTDPWGIWGIRLVRNKVEKSPVDRVAVLIISLILIGLRKLAGQ